MRAVRTITIAGLIVGTMDITAAITQAISRGATATRLLQFVASGLIGQKAFTGGAATAALGLGLHFVIAFVLVTIFYVTSGCIVLLRRYAVVAGLIYGLIVFGVMNLIVLPLSAAKPRHSLTGDLIQIGIHMFIIGLATSLLIRRLSGENRA